MNKLNIPSLGDKFKLAQDWVATIQCESRNYAFVLADQKISRADWLATGEALRKVYDIPPTGSLYGERELKVDVDGTNYYLWHPYTIDVVIPAGTELIIDRLYIRKGCTDFDSVTFRIKKAKGVRLHGRFWVQLANANEIVYE